MLGNIARLPSKEDLADFSNEPEVRAILDSFDDEENIQLELHKLAADLLNEGEVDTAWKVLMMEWFQLSLQINGAGETLLGILLL